MGHLRDLVGPSAASTRPGGDVVPRVRPGVGQLLEGIDAVPAQMLGPRWEATASSALAGASVADSESLPVRRGDLVHRSCTDPAARTLSRDREQVAADAVAGLHRQIGRDACDAGVAALVVS